MELLNVLKIGILNGYELDGRKIQVRQDLESASEFSPPVSAEVTLTEATEDRTIDPNCVVFVGNLLFSAQSQDIIQLFSPFGKVLKAEIAKDGFGKSRGYSQVIMSSPEEAQSAIRALNGTSLFDRPLEVRLDKFGTTHSLSCSQVFVGNVSFLYFKHFKLKKLPFHIRWQDLKDYFRSQGFPPLHSEVLLDHSTGRSRGCGIVKFSSKEMAENAISRLNGSNLMGRDITVRFDKYS